MIYSVECQKTGVKGKADFGEMSIEDISAKQAEHRLNQSPYGYSCAIGHHVELDGGKLSCLEIDFDSAEAGVAESYEDILERLRKTKKAVFTHAEVQEKLEGITFSSGLLFGRIKETGFDVALDWVATDKGRIYYS